jgi:peptidoglycan/LPS O-acetylase OafA/YrhL
VSDEIRSESLPRLTSLRYVAALLVVGHHVAILMMPRSGVESAANYGYVGVGFFFVLSGFILTWNRREGMPVRYFYGRRFARVYPLHLLTAAIAIPISFALSYRPPVWPSLANLLLLHAWVPSTRWITSLNTVSWSLACEAFFYAIFPFLVRALSKVQATRIIAGAAAYLVVGYVLVLILLPDSRATLVLYYNPAYRVGEFVLGIGLALLVRSGYRGRTPLTWALSALVPGLVLTIVLAHVTNGFLPPTRGIATLVFAPIFCVIIVAAASEDLVGRRGWLASKPAVTLGEASFALYMIHYLPLLVWFHVHGRFASTPVSLVVGAAYAVLITVAAWIVYRAVERPVESRLRARLGTPGRRGFTTAS